MPPAHPEDVILSTIIITLCLVVVAGLVHAAAQTWSERRHEARNGSDPVGQ